MIGLIRSLTLFLISIILTCSGCVNLGAKVLPYDRHDFNIALVRSDEEELLLNLVRMRYGDNPYFFSVDSVSTQMEAGAELHTLNDQILASSGKIIDTLDINTTLNYRQRPTVSYSPLHGEKFTKQFLTPISLSTLHLLIESGWSPARVFRVTVQQVGHIPNAPFAARPSSSHAPQYQRFVTMAHLLRTLERRNLIDFTSSIQNKNFVLDARIARRNDRDVQTLYRLLSIKGNPSSIKFYQSYYGVQRGNHFSLQTRSLMGVLYYLSKSVDVTADDVAKGLIELPMQNGRPFDWRLVTQSMLAIHTSNAKPVNASVRVFYRNKWFYIADNDLDSKQTMTMLQQLYSLQSGEVPNTRPVLTLPV